LIEGYPRGADARAPLQLALDDAARVDTAGIDFQVAQFAIGAHQGVLLCSSGICVSSAKAADCASGMRKVAGLGNSSPSARGDSLVKSADTLFLAGYSPTATIGAKEKASKKRKAARDVSASRPLMGWNH
jgi:hypothetical protein